jgi:O-antigen ligase
VTELSNKKREIASSPAAAGERARAPARREARGAARAATSGDDRIEAALLIGLAGGLAWAPFWLGGDRLIPWGVNAVLFPGLTLLHEASLLARGRRHAVAARQIAAPIALFLVAALWAVAQTSPLASAAFAHPIWAMASDALGTALPATISVDPPATLRALMRLITAASVLWLSMQLCRDSSRALWLLQAVAAIVAAYAAYGIVLAVGFGAAIPLFDVPGSGGFIRSTFVNRNSFATYAGLGLIVVVALTLRLYRHAVPDVEGVASYRFNQFIAATGRKGSLLIGAGLLILVALLGTASRGGVLSSAVGLFAVLALALARRRRRRGDQIEAIAFVAAAIAIAFVFFGDRFVGRIVASSLDDVSRASVYAIAIHAIMDSPLLGFGYGTFADVFPMYRDQSIPPLNVWDLAHNTYLEVWLGLGLVFGAALMAAIVLLAWKCLAGAVNRQRDSLAPIVATGAALLTGVHALVDFSLQMQAVTLTFMALIGAGVAQSESSRHAVAD